MPIVKVSWSEDQYNEYVDGACYNQPYSIPCIGEDRYIADQMLKLGHTKYKYKAYEAYPDYNHILEADGIQT